MSTKTNKVQGSTRKQATTRTAQRPRVAAQSTQEVKSRPKFIPIDIESAIKNKAPYSATKCGDCQYFKGSRHPSYDAPCQAMGRLAVGVAPTCFAPNVNALKNKGTQMATALNVLAGQLNTQQLRTIGTLMVNAHKLRKLGFDFLERVYFAVGSSRYLSNYYAGHVIGSAGYSGHLIVLGAKRTGTNSIVAYLDRESLLSLSDYEKRRETLVSRGLIYDPNTTRKHPPVLKDDKAAQYVPPMIDTSIESLEARAAGPRRQKTLTPGANNTRVSTSVELVFG